MTERILGPKGRTRRRRALLGPALLVVLVALYVTAGAQTSVHDIGVFQLDGNALTSDTSPAGQVGDDWDKICKPPSTTCIDSPSANLTASTFDRDLTGGTPPVEAQNATIFTGGGSKDDLDIDGWQWKDESGGLPDKDNLQQGFSARYLYTTTLTAPVSASDTTIQIANASYIPATAGHAYHIIIDNESMLVTGGQGTTTLTVSRSAGAVAHSSGAEVKVSLLYFGGTRFDNSGDAQIGFWFLQGNVKTIVGAGKSDKNSFGPDKHKVGDLLILSDFTNGGAQPTIRVYKWVGTGGNTDNTLQTVTDPAAPIASCIAVPAQSIPEVSTTSPFCAVVNPGDGVTSPWTFLNKDNQSTFAHGELYEGGINLSAFPELAQECFGTFLVETRSSQSADATLKDFILGPLQECEAKIVTAPSATSLVLNGQNNQTVTDTATVTGVGTLTPTGKVQFFFCTPAQLTPVNTGTCSSGGTQVIKAGSDATGEPLSGSGGVATATSGASPAITAIGKYCWRGVYQPATGSPYKSVSDSGPNECLTVTDTSSVSSLQTWVPNDSATAASLGGTALNGTLKIELFESSDCTGTAVAGQTYTKTLTNASTATERTLTTTNSTYSVGATKTVSWKVTFTSTDSNVASPSSSHCESTSLTITN